MRRINFTFFILAVFVFTAALLLSFFKETNWFAHTFHTNMMRTAGDSATKGMNKAEGAVLYQFMGRPASAVRRSFGQPQRIDLTNYGYSWYIYGIGTSKYMQFGIDSGSGKVSTIYATGQAIDTSPYPIGMAWSVANQRAQFSNVVSVSGATFSARFELSAADKLSRPLIMFNGNWVQLNFDSQTGRLVAVRLMTSRVLAASHPYSVIYSGKLPSVRQLDSDRQQQADSGADQEIYAISNVFRLMYGRQPLAWSEAAHAMAYQHSKEMHDRHYFSHDSKWSGDFKNRLEQAKIAYQVAGENIAAHYPDAPAVCLGWLNSPEHRENLLNTAFTELGVGTYLLYYTQDFVHP
ncbi:MAG: CAP domain-containing protein [Sporolactobacillus sp.]